MKVDANSAHKVLIKDPVMLKLVESHQPPQIGEKPVFFSLVRAIISQQLSEAAASTIFKRLSTVSEIAPTALLSLGTDSFRGCGISLQKTAYIKGIAEATLDGQVGAIDSMGDNDAINELIKLKGVGRWTAEMILIFALGREDVWPCDDAGLIRAAKNEYGITDIEEYINLGEKFRPFRTYAACYLWKSLDIK